MSRRGLSLAQAVNKKLLERRAFGNTGDDLAALCADLLGEDLSGGDRVKTLQRIANSTFLGAATLDRVAKEGGNDFYDPKSSTLKRIMIHYRQQIIAFETKMDAEFDNQPKEEYPRKKKDKGATKVAKLKAELKAVA